MCYCYAAPFSCSILLLYHELYTLILLQLLLLLRLQWSGGFVLLVCWLFFWDYP
jgi:hypothetical protein